MPTQSTKTQSTTNFVSIITLSVPVLHPTLFGLRTSIASSTVVEGLFFTKSEFFRRMAFLNLRNITIVYVHDYPEEYNPREIPNKFEGSVYTLTTLFIKSETFFSHNCFEYFFDHKRKNNFEFIYVFQNLN
jgi:hypothetical protein